MAAKTLRVNFVLLAAMVALSGCVTATTMKVSAPKMTIVEMIPLSVAVVIPPATRDFALASYRPTGCFGGNDISGPFGTVFVDTFPCYTPLVILPWAKV